MSFDIWGENPFYLQVRSIWRIAEGPSSQPLSEVQAVGITTHDLCREKGVQSKGTAPELPKGKLEEVLNSAPEHRESISNR